jgi:hypothetical protein
MRTAPIALCLVVAAGLTACGGGHSSGGAGPATTVPTTGATGGHGQAVAEIKANWATFFHTGTDPATAQSLLQDGAHLAAAIRLANNFAKQQKLVEDAVVQSVSFVNSRTATVRYTLENNGKPLLSNATGTAVLRHGGWKVSKATFCGLVSLAAAGKKVPGCS